MAALKDAKVSPDHVGYVNAHGTSTPIGDAIETIALKRVFGDRAKKVPVSSTKSMTGHLLGGAGGLEAGISVLALRDQILPPTINYEKSRSGMRPGLHSEQRAKSDVDYALSNSFGFGGTNAALQVRSVLVCAIMCPHPERSREVFQGFVKIAVCIKQVPAKDAPLRIVEGAAGFAKPISASK